MPQYPVIGIAGPARAGKDTVASYILAARGYGYRYGFADPLKRMLLALNIDCTDPFWVENKERPIPALGGVSLRHLMQTLGTEWGRQLVHPDLWVTLAKQQYADAGPGMVIADVRFENEAKWIRATGGLVIHIRRTNVQQVKPHVSEFGVAIEPTDVCISNNGTLEQLHAAVSEMFGHG